MPRKTDGEKIDELEKLGATLKEWLSATAKRVDAVYEAHSETAKALADLRREHEKEIALLKRELEDLKKWKDDQKKATEERSRRIWAFGPNLLAAVIGGSITAAVTYLLRRP